MTYQVHTFLIVVERKAVIERDTVHTLECVDP